MNISSNSSVVYNKPSFNGRLISREELEVKRVAIKRVQRAFDESAQKGYVTPKKEIRSNLLEIWKSPVEKVKKMLAAFPDNHN
jgi:hypothetical protein